MEGQTITALFVVGVIAVVVVYDLIAYAVGGNDATISKTLNSVATKYPKFAILVAFLTGVLFGHVFLPQHIPAP